MTEHSFKEKSIRVPYSERRTIKKYLVPRTVRRKRRKFLFRTSFLLLLLLSFLILRTGIYRFQESKQAENTEKGPVKPVASKANKSDLSKSPFFVYTVSKGYLGKTAICAVNKDSNSLTVILIGGDVYVPVLGLGITNPSSLTEEFLTPVFASIKNSFGYEIAGPFKVRPEVLQEENLQKSPISLIESVKELNSNLKKEATPRLKTVEIIPCPTRLTKVGEKTVMIVDQEKLNEAAGILFSNNFKKRSIFAEVVIINGSGLPGAGTEASVRLISAGCFVKAIRNAQKFDQLLTEIRVEDEEVGKKIQDALGCGEIKKSTGASGVSDAVIILGKDFSTSSKK